MQRKSLTAEKALRRLEDLCARSEQCSGELRQKLHRWGIGPDDAVKIMESLQEGRFVDDSRFASAYVREKVVFARWGRMKIIRGMIVKRLPKDVIDTALAEIDMEVYTDNLRRLIASRLASDPSLAATYEGRTKLYRSLLSRGYETRLASKVLTKYLTETDRDQQPEED